MFASNATAQVWATAIQKHQSEDKTIVYRYVKEFAKGFDKSAQPNRIIIVWKYVGEKGMPPISERIRMDTMEDALQSQVEKASFATLALVSTGDNLREWTYYAQSEEGFFDRINQALKSLPKFPIEIHAGPDLKWSTYEEFKAGVRE